MIDMSLINSIWIYPLTGLLGCIILVIFFVNYKLSYWKRRGLTNYKAHFLVGNMGTLVKQQETFGEHIKFHYDYLKSKNQRHGGEYFFLRPLYIPVDPILVKHIMQSDFGYFVDRGVYYHERDPLSCNLFFLEGDNWKNLRSKLTPTFTTGKLKMMFGILLECTKELKIEMDRCLNTPIEIKHIFGRYTTDIIGSVAFGIECNSLKNPDCDFRSYGQKFFTQGLVENFISILCFVMPDVMDYFKPNIVKPDVTKFFMNVIRNTVEYREKHNIKRKDFMDLLLQLKNTGRLEDEHLYTKNESSKKITFNELAAQAFVFFIAGYETSSTTMTFACYELAKNTELQDKLRCNIQEVLNKYEGNLTYEAIMEMNYLDHVINETLRMYPPLPSLNRICVKDFKVPDTDIVIEKGTKVNIPVQGLQMDEEYFPNPETFDPDRFSEENKKNIHPFTFLPFGEGPRICIGERFGKLQSKMGLIVLLQNYKFTLNSQTSQPLIMDPRSFIPSAKGGVWLNFQKLNE